MNVFYVKCPTKVNLYLNNRSSNDLSEKLVMVNDTVEVYDEMEITVSSKSVVSKVYLNGVLTLENNLIKKAIGCFFNYTKLPIQGVCVKIDKKVPYQLDLNSLESLAAGVILTLNMHYRLGLGQKELMEIAKGVSDSIPYYISGGYQKISCSDKLNYQKVDSIHDSYLIALGSSKDNWTKNLDLSSVSSNVPYNNRFYNCLEQLAPDELLDLKKKLLELKADKVCVNGITNSVLAYFYNYHDRFKAREELKGQKVKTLVAKPCSGIKITHKYI